MSQDRASQMPAAFTDHDPVDDGSGAARADFVTTNRECEIRVLAAKEALDRADEMGWLFAAVVRDGFEALEQRLGDVLKENLRFRKETL